MTVSANDVDAGIARATSAVAEGAILDALGVLMATLSPPRRERPLAENVAAWGRRAHPDVAWEVDALDEASANLFARSRHGSATRELALYGHLDTSLTGEAARDFAITGELDDPVAFRFDSATRMLRGFGVGVAKAASAAGIVSFLSAAAALRALDAPHRLTLLLAAGGTHRAAPADGSAHATRFGVGVEHALAGGWRPSAVLNVKGGPGGVLYEEPATAYLRVRLRARWTAALVRASVAPEGGLVRHAGALLDAIEGWRAAYLRAHPPAGQLACEIAIGALRGGSPEKADLIPGLLEAFVYAVLPPDEDPASAARELAEHVRPRVADLPGRPSVEVDAYASASGGATDPSSEIVRLAREAWTAHVGKGADGTGEAGSLSTDPMAVRGWTGATDGAVLQAAGIPTVRMGAYVNRDPVDPRIEIVSMDELLSAARAYVEVAVRYFAARPGRGSAVGS